MDAPIADVTFGMSDMDQAATGFVAATICKLWAAKEKSMTVGDAIGRDRADPKGTHA